MSTLQAVELGVLGPLQVRRDGAPVMIPGAKPRAILTMLGLHGGSVVSAETLIELLWGDDPPRTAAKALQTHISSLRRTLGDGFVLTAGTGWTLAESGVDASRYKSAARLGRDAAAAGDTSQAVFRFEEALALWRGIPELPDGRRGTSEKTRWIEGYAALVEDRADALLVTGRAAEIIGELEAAVAEAPLRERRWGQLMLALYRAGRQGEALGAYQRARALLADELGVDPGPDLRRLQAAIVGQDTALEIPAAQDLPSVTRTVTFLLTDIEGSTAAWEADADAMAVALARHDELVEQVVTSRGGRLIKTRGEGDATFSVFERASAATAAAIELQDAIFHEPWGLQDPMRIRVALHTGEVELRDGDYFGRAVNRAARLRSLAIGGQILCSGAIAELVVDSLPDDVVLADLGMRQLRNLARPEHVFELRMETASDVSQTRTGDEPLERPGLPAVLTGPGPFVGRGRELEGLVSAWQTALAGGTHAVLIAGEPGVGKTRLAGEWSQQAYQLEAIVLYGRCDEDLGAPYQPFAEALRSLVPCLGTSRLRGMRGVEALLTLVPGLTEVLPDLAAPTRADPETERYALFDAVVALLELASAGAPVVLILDDLHWAAKPTLLLLRHLLRFGDRARVQIVGTYRSTDLDRSHPLAAMLADLHRGAGSGTANRLALSGLDEADVTAYVTEAGYNDEELARALASVTGGNPFFLIEALRHVDETGGVWDPTTLPQGVRETVSRRLSRLPAETNTALAAAAVVGSRFALDLVEKVVEQDLVDAFDEACKAGIVIEEPGGRYRFNHAIVRQSLLAELPSVRRMRLHQRIAVTLEAQPGADDELLAELAHHYFECAWAGNAAKAVEYCRRAADQAVARLSYEGAADLYGQALHALEEIDDELPDRDAQAGELLVARCEALLAAGDVALAAGAVSQFQASTVDSARLAAWATCFDGELSMLIHPERLDEVEAALGLAAQKLAEIDDAAGEAKAHTVRAACLARLGRIGDGEIALDDALTAARRARDHRRVNAVLAGAPLAALWGPNPVPRAGGRCLDVVRLLRITTDSPAVEATSTRCQAVLEAFRGRGAAARRMIDSARRTVTELGLRHALLEVEQFAGIVELIVDDPTAAEPHFRQAYNGFRRMGLDADTAETAALLGGTCLALDRDTEADELCLESERLAGHALKASIAWRTLRARLLSRGHEHGEARRTAEAAVALAEHTDALVDHGDSCLTLATVLGAAGDAAGARTAAERAVDLYERKGAAALAERARRILGEPDLPSVPAPSEPPPVVELDNACTRAGKRLVAAINRGAFDEYEQLHAPNVFSESHRKAVGFTHAAVAIVPPENWAHEVRRVLGTSGVRLTGHDIAVRGERLALARVVVGTADANPGAPHDEFLEIYGIDEEGRISLQIFFDLEDMDAAIAELDAAHARFEEDAHRRARRLENAASQAAERHSAHFAARDWDALAKVLADDFVTDDRRRAVNAGIRRGRDAEIANMQAAAEVGITYTAFVVIAVRDERLILARASVGEGGSAEFTADVLSVVEINLHNQIAAFVIFEEDDFDDAIAELDARYLAGEAAAHAHTWSVVTGTFASVSRQELPALTPDCVTIDHRRVTAFAPGEMTAYIRAGWEIDQTIRTYGEVVHRLSDLGAVCTYAAHGVSREGFDGDWRGVNLATVDGDMVNRSELFDEADLDAALARFDQLSRPAPRLDNAASQAVERYLAHFAAREWDELAKVLAADISVDDRRRVVNAGTKHGRDAEIANLRTFVDVGITYFASVVIAARGQRLILARFSGGEGGGFGEFFDEVLGVVEINSHNQIAVIVLFELDDFDSAIAELDGRYIVGEAASYGNVLQPVMDAVGELNRHKPGPMLGRLAFADHRRVPFGSAENYGRAIEELWTPVPDARYWTKTVHALDAHGLVSTLVIEGTDAHGNELQWGRTFLFLSDGPRVEVYEEDGLDAALARFEELRPPARRLENAASQVAERYMAHFAARDWDELAKVLADDISVDDRRRAVNAGIRHDRDAEIANLQATADVGITYLTAVAIAARGERLILTRTSGGEGGSGEFVNDVLGVVEINSHNQIAAIVVFDPDDFEAAFAELDARYLAGEAAAHARTWSVIREGYAAQARHEFPAMTPDCVTIDHRRVTAFAPGEMTAYIRAGWDLGQTIRIYVEVVHRLSDLGAVCTYAGHGVSREGFDAEWRDVAVTTVAGDMANRCELFDETEVDAAIARFEQLTQPAPRLENAASQVYERFLASFAARDWDAAAQLLADAMSTDDRRRVVNSGIQDGREANIANMRALADLGVMNMTSEVIATRGNCLALSRIGSAAFQTEVFNIVEIDADELIVAVVGLDLDDFDAAIAEIDARYLAGEAAAHARSWSVVARAYAAIRQREFGPMTTDFVNIDHRRGAAYAPGELIAYVRAGWDLGQDIRTYIEAVNRLDDFGAVLTHVGNGTSQEGFDAEWRGVQILTVDGEMVNRSEVFDEEDLDAAIARFEELHPPTPRLENSATRAFERLFTYIAARDWDAWAQTTAENVSLDDRRRVVNAGIRHGRDANITDTQATVDVGFAMTMVGSLATRGERLALIRVRVSGRDPGAIQNDALNIVEIDADDRIVAGVVFDLDDVEAAVGELDARYIAGEAAGRARTWSVIAGVFVAHNRREIAAATTDVVSIDHRRGAAFAPGEGLEYIRAGWDLDQTLNVYIEAAHRVNELGAVFTWAGYGTSHEGFEAEWRGVEIMTVDGDLLSRAEVFDEADLDAALAKFDELSRPAPRLENAASQAYERFRRYFADRDWAAMAELLTADTSVDDHRRVVNAEIRRGRDVEIANMRAFADIGAKKTTATVIAIRGEHLVLCRTCISGEDEQPGGFRIEMLNIVETTAEKRILARVAHDPDDIDAAIEELDARYIAGEAAPNRDAWSVIAAGYAALNRYEVPPSAPDYVAIDHRLQHLTEAANLGENLRAAWELTPELKGYVEVVHRLSSLGAVVTHAAHGTTRDGLDAEWRGIHFLTLDGGMVNRCEVFFEADLDAAVARFDELSRPARRMENAASRVHERFLACFAAGDWDAIAEIMAEGFSHDDRRPVVGAGVQHGRDAYIVDMRAVAELWNTNLESTVVAIRGERLVLMRNRLSVRDEEPEAFSTEVLAIGEIDADERGVAVVTFDVDDIEAAFEELDARYLAGEAAPHAHTWSVIARIYAGFNRREPPATTLDSVFTDHRPLQNLGAVDLVAAIRSMWDVASDLNVSIEAVHRLSELGAVVTQTLKGTSQEGLDAEWRTIEIFTVEGDLLSRCEAFDETDLDAALARFEELHPPTPRLENAASQVAKRFWGYFVARDWDAMAVLIADDVATEDRRRVVSAGSWHGRDFDIASMRATADIGASNATLTVVATRGNRLALSRVRLSGRDQRPEAFHTDALGIAEIDSDGRLVAHVAFDPDDFDAAFAELDARYLAGEAAAHAQSWSVITRAYAALNRRELPATTPDWVTIDHRRGTSFASGEMPALLDAVWNLTTDLSHSIEAVHRLSDVGAVVTNTSHETSQEGFDAEWRVITVATVEGDLLNRCEVFDESDLGAAIARFDELSRPARRLENAASRVHERFLACFAAGDWDAIDAIAEIMAEDFSHDDRRPVVGAGVQLGRDAYIVDMRAVAELWNTNLDSTVVAIRGERLVLMRNRLSVRDEEPEAFSTEVLAIGEIDADERGVAVVTFDVDDIDAALAELDARYLAGEAVAHANTWSVIAGAHAAFNRHELPATTPDPVYIDHRPLVSIEGADLAATLRAVWELTPQFSIYIEAVHRLDELGAVYTQVLNGTSPEGLDAEWRMIDVFTVEGDLFSRVEVFEEADLDAALARFEELHPQPPRLENAASRLHERFLEYYAAGDSQAMAEMLADNYSSDDRRRVVGSGVRHGRDAHIADMRARAELWNTDLESTVMAIRGERLALMRIGLSDRDEEPQAFSTEVLAIGEIDADERLVASVTFDLDEIDAAFPDLDARYLAGEASVYARTWSAIAGVYAAFNRRELPAPDYVTIDHRRATLFTSSELAASIRDSLDLTPDLSIHIEAVHRLAHFGALLTNTSYGTSQEGFDAEWRMIQLLTVEGDRVNRLELFDEADLDAALARFDELRPQPLLENAAGRILERYFACFSARDWAAMTELLADDIIAEDRRRVVNAGIRRGRDVHIADNQAAVEVGAETTSSSVIATRGERLALAHLRTFNRGMSGEVGAEMLVLAEIDAEDRLVAGVIFDLDDTDAAVAELEARYLAGEASDYAHTWSVITLTTAAFNRHELPAADWVIIDHRPLAPVDASDLPAAIRAIWDLTPDLSTRIEAVHRLSSFGAVVTNTAHGTSPEGFAAEWRVVDLVTVEGDRISRDEFFDEADLDAALARFDEFEQPTPSFENAATRVWAGATDAFNRRDVDGLLALANSESRYEDRRKGLRDTVEGPLRRKALDVMFETVPSSWRMEVEPIAIRGFRLSLTRGCYRDVDDADRPIAVELLHVVELDDVDLIRDIVSFDPDDLDDAVAELTTRWIASGEVAYPELIQVVDRINAAINRHDWDAVATYFDGADYVNHRQLAHAVNGTIADWLSSLPTTGSLVPNLWVELAEVLARSAIGIVGRMAVKGTSTDGAAIEIPFVVLMLLHGERVTRLEAFDEDQRELALARLQEFNRPV
jgi:DNA-binding SARP family transcriptional activator